MLPRETRSVQLTLVFRLGMLRLGTNLAICPGTDNYCTRARVCMIAKKRRAARGGNPIVVVSSGSGGAEQKQRVDKNHDGICPRSTYYGVTRVCSVYRRGIAWHRIGIWQVELTNTN